MVNVVSLEVLENTQRVAREVLADLLEGILLRRGLENGRNVTGRRRKKELTLEEQTRAEGQRKKLRTMRGE